MFNGDPWFTVARSVTTEANRAVNGRGLLQSNNELT